MTKIKSVFELTKLDYRTGKPEYPKFDVYYDSIGYFSSLEKTEQQLHEIARESEIQKDKFFGFLIEEYPLDDRHFDSYISRRSYLPDGSLLDECLTSAIEDNDGCLEEFIGRPENKVRFKIGDLVEVLFNETVTLEIVGNLPPSLDEVQYMKKESSDFHLDSDDDRYYVLNQYGRHSHPYPIDLFPVRSKVREQLRKKLFSDDYYSYRAFYDNVEKKNV
jgi:hypothetical protein